MQSKVRIGTCERELFDNTYGVREGITLSTLLFIMYMYLLIREVATTQLDHNYMVHVVDIPKAAAAYGELADIKSVWQAAFNRYHLKLNLLQT